MDAPGGFYRIFRYNCTSSQPWEFNLEFVGGGIYDPNKEGTISEQVLENWKQGFRWRESREPYLEPGTYFAIPESWSQGTAQNRIVVEPQVIKTA